MLDIYPMWFVVLLLNFLGLMFILNILLFKPLLKIFKEREDIVSVSLEAARQMNAKKEEATIQMNKELAEVRLKAKEVFEKLRGEGALKQKDILSVAEADASAMLQSARQELQSEADKARKALRADVEKFSDEIVRKLVKA